MAACYLYLIIWIYIFFAFQPTHRAQHLWQLLMNQVSLVIIHQQNVFYLHVFILIFVHTCCLNQLISLYLLYFAESEFCGVYHASTGTLDSPNYPNNYPNNYHCLWLITLPSGDERVGIHIVDFNVESHSTCKWDALEVREVNNIFLKRTAHWWSATQRYLFNVV